ncbi:hypothetical protein Tco_0252573 [Tanacetum coccineum]
MLRPRVRRRQEQKMLVLVLKFEDVSTGFTDINSKTKIGSSAERLLIFIQKKIGTNNSGKIGTNADLVKEFAGERCNLRLIMLKRMVGVDGNAQKEATDEDLKVKFRVFDEKALKGLMPIDTEKESKEKTEKREEGFELKSLFKRYTKRKSLQGKGLQRKPESAKSGTEEDVEAYMEERVDEPSSEEFPMSSIPQGPAPAKIVKWQIIKTGKRGAYQIIREDNTDVVYVNFQGLLNDLTRDDLKELYRLMMLKYGDNRPEEEFERVLWGDLKTMFDPPSEEDPIWKLPHQQQILNWRYFHSCSVHCLTVEAAHIYMLTEVKYPLPPRVCKAMLEKKLLGDRKDEVCYQLLKLIERQAQQQ